MRISKLLLLAPIAVLAIGCGGGGLFNGSFFNHGGGGTPPPNPLSIYASNMVGASVTVYPLGSNGDVAPSRDIVGCLCHVDSPAQAFVDGSGNLFLVNQGSTNPASVVVFANGANGNVAPTRQFTYTGFNHPFGIAVDGSGNTYVSDPSTSAIYVFSSGVNGATTPIRTISGASTMLQQPEAIAFAPNGNLYVADRGAQALLAFAPGANGNVAPVSSISGANTTLANGPSGMAFDAAGNIFTTTPGAILEFGAGASGNASPIKNISGAATNLSNIKQIGLDSSGNMYVGSGTGNAVYMFAPAANGNVAPTQTISGPNTKLSGPYNITI